MWQVDNHQKFYLSIFIIVFSNIFAFAQDAPPPKVGCVSTGALKVYASRRTTGIVDKNAPKVYEDVTLQTALKDFRCVQGGGNKDYILELIGCAVAVFDYDNDGKPDIFLLNCSTMDAENGREKPPKSALFHNLGNWKFEDVTAKAGAANERWGMGVAVGDFNNDGFFDLFVSNYGVSRLYKNNGDGTFTDVAPKVGLDIKGWHTGATFGDYDKDGRLDVIVSNEDSAPTLLRNVAETKNNRLDIKLIGDVSKKTPRDAIGSCVFVTTGKLRQRFDLISGASYASQSSQIIHVGLGDSTKIDELKVVWANGQTEKFSIDKTNTQITLKQTSGN